MKSDEPSRMALMVAGQRAAHQLLMAQFSMIRTP